jgi:hypothetical protein
MAALWSLATHNLFVIEMRLMPWVWYQNAHGPTVRL